MVFVRVDSHDSTLRPFLRPQWVPAVICVDPQKCRHRRPPLAGKYIEQLLYKTILGNEFLARHLQSMVYYKEVELIVSDERSCRGGLSLYVKASRNA